MKVLVLSCSTGGGHNTCGQYITQEFNENGISCDFVDYFSLLSPTASKRAEKLYLESLKANGNIFKGVYKLGELYNKTRLSSPIYALNKLVKNKLHTYIMEHQYDFIIASHLFPAMAATALKEEQTDLKLITIATDYTIIPFWEETKPDYCVIPHESLKESFLERGFQEKQLLSFGISVSSSFFELQHNLNLPQGKDIILITSGSMGFGKITDLVQTLLDEPNIYFIVICGNNQDLYTELSHISNPNLSVKSFVHNMNEYIAASTIVLTKPGGLTSTETGLLHKPMVLLPPIPGVENYNAEFFSKHGLGLVSNTMEEVLINTKKLLQDKSLQQTMIEKQKNILNPYPAKKLVDFVKNNLSLVSK